jgi:hypothetical protein
MPQVGATANLDSSCARRRQRSQGRDEETDFQIEQRKKKDAPPCLNFLTKKASEEKHEPVSDIDTVLVDRLKALDPNRPIREADIVYSTFEPSRDNLKGSLASAWAVDDIFNSSA